MTKTLEATNASSLGTVITTFSPVRVAYNSFANRLDMTPIKYKMVREKGWTHERADRVEPQYKAFLFLLAQKKEKPFVPSVDVDDMWHAHILDTRKYMIDCAEIFGEYLHHYPYLGLKDAEDKKRLDDQFSFTASMMAEMFGEDERLLNMAECGGGGCTGGGGGDSGSSSCTGGGHGDSGGHGQGHGHGSHDTGYYAPFPSSCSSGSTYTPSRDRGRNRKPPAPNPARPEPKKGILRRILGLSPREAKAALWHASVNPALFPAREYRPDTAAYKKLKEDSQTTVH